MNKWNRITIALVTWFATTALYVWLCAGCFESMANAISDTTYLAIVGGLGEAWKFEGRLLAIFTAVYFIIVIACYHLVFGKKEKQD